MAPRSIMDRPHFVPADWPFDCSECRERFPANSLMMVYRERTAPDVLTKKVVTTTRHLCEECGKLLLECF
jgi:hypothetical protein